MIDRYLEMTAPSDRRDTGASVTAATTTVTTTTDSASLSPVSEAPSESSAARAERRVGELRKRSPRWASALQQCEAEVTRTQWRCAMRAPSPEMWQACLP